MERREVVRRLRDLVQLDVDAAHAYEHALRHVDLSAIADEFGNFREAHRQHAAELLHVLKELGELPSTRESHALRGLLLEGLATVGSMAGTRGALEALQAGERVWAKAYGQMRLLNLPPRIREMIEKFYREEERHLAFLDRSLRDRAWES